MNAPDIEGSGIFTMQADRYHADPAPQPSLSNSLMKPLLRSTPLHAWMAHPRLNPQWQPAAGADKFDIGSAAHALLLEGDDKAVVIDAEDWRTKAAKEARDEARASGKLALLTDQHEAVQAMTAAARDFIDTTQLRGILRSGSSEQSVIWRDAQHVWCRARLDLLSDDRSVILDYKSTGLDGPAEWMGRHMVANGYDTQAVFYPRGIAALGHRRPRFIFLVQEVFAPYLCYLVEPTETMNELGEKKVARALPLWRGCLASNRWPGYSTDVYQADPPVWAIKDEELAT